jgi:DNA-binding transcriptional MerR regulator
MASELFTLAQLARAVGMSVDDVQFYRNCGLLQPPRRQRHATDDLAFQGDHVERLRFIQRAIDHGFFLEDIECFVDEASLVTCNDVHRIAVHRLAEYRRARSAEHPTVIGLEKLIASCGGVGGRSDCQILAILSKRQPGAAPITFDKDQRHNVTLVSFSGEFGIDTIARLDHAGKLLVQAEGPTHFLLDFSGIERVSMPESAIADRGRRPPLCTGYRRVIVAPQPEIFGLYRLFAAKAGLNAPVIVRSIGEALAHLGLRRPVFKRVNMQAIGEGRYQ